MKGDYNERRMYLINYIYVDVVIPFNLIKI